MIIKMDKRTDIEKNAVVYIHGRGGKSEEAKHYVTLFPESDVKGFDYMAQTPWEAEEEFSYFFNQICKEYGSVILVANSIGAWLAMSSGIGCKIRKAFFISPIVDMELVITGMMMRAGTTEDELRSRETVRTDSGDILSWKYLCYVRDHPIRWCVPTEILYGRFDSLTVMENGEHWFHTEEQMRFLDEWIRQKRFKT